MHRKQLSFLFIGIGFHFFAQDTVQFKDVVISSYLSERPMLRAPASVAVVDSTQISKQSGQSLLPMLNTVPGVRMEERSPGSYRLSIRGSLLRSPFGVRNIKVYIDEFPLTNGGGDTYLNLLDFSGINNIEVLKGPDGSLFGANSGGVVRISPNNLHRDSSFVSIATGAGSFGLFRENINVQQCIDKNVLSVSEAWQRSDGYRQNSALDRKYIQLADRFNYKSNAQLRFFFFYSDLNYQTPGGLTQSEFEQNPRAARPATKTLPSAIQQCAAVRDKTLFGGISEDIKINEKVRYVASVFGSQTFFENPFITNYETRNETNAGTRTWLEVNNRADLRIKLKWDLGIEAQQTHSSIFNYGNYLGNKDTVQAADKLIATQAFAFTRLSTDINNVWLIDASLSYNYNRLDFTHIQPNPIPKNNIIFRPQLMPRLSASYCINKTISLRGIISRGYSPPTLDEIRSSNNIINTSLQPESGWNYEIGLRLRTLNNSLWWDVSAFYYRLDHAIVDRIDVNGNEYFINSGGTNQPGIESQIVIQVIKQNTTHFIRQIELRNSYTLNLFTFRNYVNGLDNYSGNNVTGIPKHVSVTGLTVNFPLNIYLFGQYNYTSAIALNDANTTYANEYHLILLKVGYKFIVKKTIAFEINGGVDNLLNQRYSLGNDLNAIGGRYYNAAMPRNYFVNFIVSL